MKVEQIYTGCLSQAAYYIESNGEAAIIDPLRDVTHYINRIMQDGAVLKFIFETHFHADFVSGHLSLAEKTGATIIYGPDASPNFDCFIAQDEDVFKIGDCEIKILHTPGHTLESSTFLLFDEQGKEHAIFTGDTLFLGDVGRPDLAQKGKDMTTEKLAGLLFDSLRKKIFPLPDDVIVYPGHGAGSACGKKMMKETIDTLGHQKKVNYALRADMSKEEFVTEVTDGLSTPPAYFPINVQMNKEGYRFVDEVIADGNHALDTNQFEEVANSEDVIILDVRHQDSFCKGHIPQSIFIGLGGSFAPWVGELLKDVHQKILLVVHPFNVVEAITRLTRVGFDNVIGYLDGGFKSWLKSGKEIDRVRRISAAALGKKINAQEQLQIIDVRTPNEYKVKHITNAINIPLRSINSELHNIPQEGNFYLHCASGYRSMIASSILKARGIHHFTELKGGIKAINKKATTISKATID